MTDRLRPTAVYQSGLATAIILGLSGCPVVNAPPSAISCDDADAGDCAAPPGEPGECVCTLEYKPVCGEDGKTYGNACEARCASASIEHAGECDRGDQGCACDLIYAPVCGKDGKTYGNACQADCAKVSIVHDGECKDSGAAGDACKTNDDCSGTEVCHPERRRCQPECTIACLRYEPVCGEDGVTYGCGQADAACHGTAVAHDGECATKGGCSYEGKTYPAGASFPAEDGCNDCSCQADGTVACTLKLCACDYSSASGRRYVAQSPEACMTVRFACEQGQRAFFDDCGCGCEAEATATGCKVGGCSSQLCVDANGPDVVSTCEWTEAYACYKTATCEPQQDGACGWTQTDELRECLDAAR